MLPGNRDHSTMTEEQRRPDDGLVFDLMLTGRYAEAYTLLKGMQDKLDPGSRYNLSLCLFHAERYREATTCLDEALRKEENGLMYSALPADAAYHVLLEKESATGCYQQPLPGGYATRFPGLLADHIIRLKVDCYVKLEEWNSVLRLAASLQGKRYTNIIQAVALAKSKNEMV